MTSELEWTDARLIAEFRSQPVQIGEELYRAHAGAALRVARREVSEPQDAEDAVAEAFTRILGMMARGKGPERSFRSYLLRTVRSVLRERRRDPHAMESQDMEQLLPTETTEHTVTRREESRIVLEAYAELPERWRDVLWRLDVEGLPPRVVGEQLGLSANAVSALAVRAREGLKENFLAQSSLRRPQEACEEFVPMLAPYVRGRLTAGRTRRLQAHLKVCPYCNASYLALVETSELMRAEVFPVLLVAAALGWRHSGISTITWQRLVAPLGQPFLQGKGFLAGGLGGTSAVSGGAGAAQAGGKATASGATASSGAVGGIGHAVHALVGVGAAVMLCLALVWGVYLHGLAPEGGRHGRPTADQAPQTELMDRSSRQQHEGGAGGERQAAASPGGEASESLAATPGDAIPVQTLAGRPATAYEARSLTAWAARGQGAALSVVDTAAGAGGHGAGETPGIASDEASASGNSTGTGTSSDGRPASTGGHPSAGPPRTQSPAGVADQGDPTGELASGGITSSPHPTATPSGSDAQGPDGGSPQVGPDAGGGGAVTDPAVRPRPTASALPSGSPQPTSSPQPTAQPELTAVPQPTEGTGSPSPAPSPTPSPSATSQVPRVLLPVTPPDSGGFADGEFVVTTRCWDGVDPDVIYPCECVWNMNAAGNGAASLWECTASGSGEEWPGHQGGVDTGGTAAVSGEETPGDTGPGDEPWRHEQEAADCWIAPAEPSASRRP